MSLPVLRQQDTSQIWMPIKNHPKQIIRLTLVPISCSPNAGDTIYVDVVLIQQYLQAPAVILCRREQVIVHLEPRFFLSAAIGTTKIRQEIKPRFRPRFQKAANGSYVLPGHNKRCFSQGFDDFDNPVRVLTLERRHE